MTIASERLKVSLSNVTFDRSQQKYGKTSLPEQLAHTKHNQNYINKDKTNGKSTKNPLENSRREVPELRHQLLKT